MSTVRSAVKVERDERAPPRERILAVAADLFYRNGIRAVGVEAIAEAAGTNKMTLYRHFDSKDELVAEYLRRLAAQSDAAWDRRAAQFPNDPRAQLRAWLKDMVEHIGATGDRGCALANAAVELPEPDMLADELFLLLEGARVTAQCMGRERLGDRLVRMGETMIAAHEPKKR